MTSTAVFAPLQDEDTSDRKEVRHGRGQQRKTQSDRSFTHHPDRQVAAEPLEIPQRSEVDVRRVVPLVGNLGGPRHGSGQQQLEPAVEMSEVDEADRRPFADPHHFAQQQVRTPHLLERLADDDQIEGTVLRKIKVFHQVHDYQFHLLVG